MTRGLVYFNPLVPTKIEINVSKYIGRGIVSQYLEDRKWRPVAFRFETREEVRYNYDIHDKELWTRVQAFQQWKDNMRERLKPVRVFTNHKDMVTIVTAKELSKRQVR